MINIKSLKRIDEGIFPIFKPSDTPEYKKFMTDRAAADTAYAEAKKKFKEEHPFGFLRKKGRDALNERLFNKNKAYEEAYQRYKASKHGMASKSDFDATKFELAKYKGQEVAKQMREDAAKKAAQQTTQNVQQDVNSGIGGHLKRNWGKYALASAVVGGGLLALQKRKKRLPEPESYNQEE